MGVSFVHDRRFRHPVFLHELYRRIADICRIHRHRLAIHKGRLKKDPSHQDKAHFTDYMSGFFPIILVVFILRTFIAEPFQIPSSSMRPGLVKGDFILVNKFAYGIRTPIINNVLIPTGQIERGDVVVFNYPVQPEMNYIKRIVGLPGDTVEYRDKVLTVNGQVAPDQPSGTYSYPDDTEPSAIHSPELFQTTLNGKSFNILKEPGQPTISIPALDKYRMEIMPENGYSVEQSGLEHCQYAEDGSGFTCKVPEGRYFAMGDNRDIVPTPATGALWTINLSSEKPSSCG